MLRRTIVVILVCFAAIIPLSSCSMMPSHFKPLFSDILQLVENAVEKEISQHTDEIVNEITSPFGTLIYRVSEEPFNPFGNLIDPYNPDRQSPSFSPLPGAPFSLPAIGFLGLKYHEQYPNSSRLHAGLDIWPSQDPLNHGKPGQNIYAVYDGWLGVTGSGLEICHPDLDKSIYPNLPQYRVCTYYGHLTDIPYKFLKLQKNNCNNLLEVKRGDFLGRADLDTESNIVHLHFSIVPQKKDQICWENEEISIYPLNPYLYLGINGDDYGWLDVFP